MNAPYPPDPNQQPQQYPTQPQPPLGYPTAPAPAKKNRRALWIVLSVVGVVLVACCGVGAATLFAGKKAVDSAAKSLATPTATGQAQAGDGGQAKSSHAKQGQPARDGKFEFTVTKVDYGKAQIGDQYLNKKAQGQFVLVAVTVKNIGSEARTSDGSSQKALGTGGATYTDDGEAEIYANQNNQTFLNTINPGNSASGTLVFDIPKDAKLTGVELHDSPFSGGVTVDLT